MPTKSFFNLRGFEEYLRKIEQAGRNVDRAAENAVVIGGDVMLAGMKKRVPKDTRNLENHLVRTEPERDGSYVFVHVGLQRSGKHKAPADVARYGNAQEFGYIRGGKFHKGQPYVRPTIDNDARKVRKAQRESLERDGIL